MAPATLVLDASVVVKWFSTADETELEKALDIRDAHVRGKLVIVVPDILYHEVANILVHKPNMKPELIHSAIVFLFEIGILTENINQELLSASATLARKNRVTEYDACYAVVAAKYSCPLVTANPRHQGQALGCRVIPLEEWPEETG